MANWPLGDVDKLIYNTLATDATIKTLQGISSGNARVSAYRVPRDIQDWYIFFYSIAGVAARVNGNEIVQHNPDYDIEVRTINAPTDNSEAALDRIMDLMKAMKAQLTPSGLWLVSAVFTREITIIQPGETTEVYYTRRGGTFKLAVTRS